MTKKKVCVLIILFSYRKVSIRKQFFYRVWHKNKSHLWLDIFYVSPCKKTFSDLYLYIFEHNLKNKWLFQKLFLDWSKGGRRKFTSWRKKTDKSERSDYYCRFSPTKHQTPIPRKCITWLCFHIEIDWERSRMGWGFMQNQTYCICILDGAKNLQNLKLNSI